MNAQNAIAIIITLVMAVWTASVFFKSLDGNAFWKIIASGIGFLVFGIFFVMSCLRAIKQYKTQHKAK